MRVISVSKALGVTQVTDKYPAMWDKLQEMVDNPPDWAEEATEPKYAGKPGVLLDFRGVELVRPWKCERFKRFFSNPNIYLRIYTSETVMNTINTMCRIGGMKDGRVENVDIMSDAPKQAKPHEVRIQRLANLLYGVIENIPGFGGTENWGKMTVEKVVSSMGGHESGQAVYEAIKRHADEYGLRKYRVNLGDAVTSPIAVEDISKAVFELSGQGIKVEVASKDAKTTERLRLWLSKTASQEYSEEQRLKILQSTTPVGFVGMLTRYKKTGRRDEFGRSGDGEAVACQPAIYLGVKRGQSGECLAVFRQFFLKTFMPKIQWTMDNDGDEHPGLESRILEIPLKHLGIHGMYMGRFYHFREPNLQRAEDIITTYAVGESDGTDGNEAGAAVAKVVRVSLPQHIKFTLDDFGIGYDVESLDTAIRESKMQLERLKAVK